MPHSVPIRSISFTPALKVDRLSRAVESGADVCLIDLEDSVSASEKPVARELMHKHFSRCPENSTPTAVRINAIDTDAGLDDILSIRDGRYKPDFIVIPKVESGSSIKFVETALGKQGARIRLIALVETAAGIRKAEKIAFASERMSALMFGSADYTRSIGAEICWDTLLMPRSAIVAAASNAGLASVDTPFFDIDDLDGLRADCDRVRRLGFTGRCAIHPTQTSVINSAFSYSSAAIERAGRIVAAAEASGGNICQVDGQMIGRPIVEQARRVLAVTRSDRDSRFEHIARVVS
jgi:citrate lyase subunit beta/citryl-CoA lyase/(S)-citramalyl-CoA lyase